MGDSPGALVGARLAVGDWAAPAVVFVGPPGSGKTTLVNAICRILELSGTTIATGHDALGASAAPSSVAVVDSLRLRTTADQVAALVRAGWRVIATALGPTPDVDDAFGSLSGFGLVRIVELRSLPMEARRRLLHVELSTADPSAVDLINRCGPADGRELRVLAARVTARGALDAGEIDVDVAAATLRAGLRVGASKHGPPVPRQIHDLLARPSPRAAEAVVSSLADSLHPLAVLGPAEESVKSVTPGAPVAVAGGAEFAVALRSALHHALAGRRVLLQTARLSEADTAKSMVSLAGGPERKDRRANSLAAELVAGLGVVVLADAAVSLADLPSTLRRCYKHTGVKPDIVVVDGHSLGELSWAAQIDVPVVVATADGAALPSGIQSSSIWDLASAGDSAAIRRPGSEWVPLPLIQIDGHEKGALRRDDSGAVLGWRLWELSADDQGPALKSPVRGTIWPRGVLASACPSCGPAPVNSCHCGIYAYHELCDAEAEWRQHPHLIIGQLRGWGRVMCHRFGFRAERVQPVVLHLGTVATETERRALSARYGCEATVCDGRGRQSGNT